MSRLRGIGAAGVWLGGAAALAAGCAVWVLAARADRDAPGQVTTSSTTSDETSASREDSRPGAKSSGEAEAPAKPPTRSRPAAKSGLAKAAGAEFADPSVLAKQFTTELARLVKSGKLVTPAALFRQAEAAKSCEVAPLPDPGEKLSPEAIYARARPSVVVVGAIVQPRGHKRFHAALATGFVIAKDGVIVTNYHVIEAFQHSKAVGVMTDDERVFPIQAVLAADGHNDIAVVKVEAENLAPLPIAPGVAVGAPVYCLSHPALDSEETETAFYAFTQGVVCGKFRLRVNGPVPLNVLAITADYAKGSSGGPILNEHGAVVGIICQTRALFHDEDETEPQLTWKFSRPASSLLALLKSP
jgi:S1-C subfamily serine protease